MCWSGRRLRLLCPPENPLDLLGEPALSLTIIYLLELQGFRIRTRVDRRLKPRWVYISQGVQKLRLVNVAVFSFIIIHPEHLRIINSRIIRKYVPRVKLFELGGCSYQGGCMRSHLESFTHS